MEGLLSPWLPVFWSQGLLSCSNPPYSSLQNPTPVQGQCMPALHLQSTLAGLTSVPLLAATTGSANTFTLQPGVCPGKATSLSGELKASEQDFTWVYL